MMNIRNLDDLPPRLSFGNLLERIEIIRSTLRWKPNLDRPGIEKLLVQTNHLRQEVSRLSRSQRFAQATCQTSLREPEKMSVRDRRQALIDRDFMYEGVFGENPKLLEALEIAERASRTDLPVLVIGESGTGKELLAKVVHANGARSAGPFVTLNCGAIPENLIESELFGHRKGAFTGAVSDRLGKFEAANGGTIFLDEIGELPLSGQVKLLRVLQSQEIQRVGCDNAIAVDARVVAATNRNLPEMVRAGQFREDLYYRLNVLEVSVPALRDRRDEIPLLIEYFCNEAAAELNRHPLEMSHRLRRFLFNYPCPGNIRELRNLVYRMTCLAQGVADLKHLPQSIVGDLPEETPAADNLDSLRQMKKAACDAAEKQFLETGLKLTSGKVVELARRYNLNRSHVQSLMKKHGLSAMDFRQQIAPHQGNNGA